MLAHEQVKYLKMESILPHVFSKSVDFRFILVMYVTLFQYIKNAYFKLNWAKKNHQIFMQY